MEIPIEDQNGRELGKVILNDEVEEVLKITGVSIVFDYDPKEGKAVGYLH